MLPAIFFLANRLAKTSMGLAEFNSSKPLKIEKTAKNSLEESENN
jgi:hypothetical protein